MTFIEQSSESLAGRIERVPMGGLTLEETGVEALAADTSEVMAATDPRRVENFRWHNTGLDHMIFNRTGYFSFLESGRL